MFPHRTGLLEIFKAEAAAAIMLESEEDPGECLHRETGFGEQDEVGVVLVFQRFTEERQGSPHQGDLPPLGRNQVGDSRALEESSFDFFRVLGVAVNRDLFRSLCDPFLPNLRVVNVAPGQEEQRKFGRLAEGFGRETFGEELVMNRKMNLLMPGLSIKRIGRAGEVGFIDRLPRQVGVAGISRNGAMQFRDKLVGSESMGGNRFGKGIHRGHDLIVGAFVNGPSVGIESLFHLHETLTTGIRAFDVLAAQIKDSPVVGEVDAGDQFAEIGVQNGIVFQQKDGWLFQLFGLANGESDGESEGVAALVLITAGGLAEAGIDSREAFGGDADLIEVPFQFCPPVLPATEVEIVAEGKGFFEVHGAAGGGFSFP